MSDCPPHALQRSTSRALAKLGSAKSRWQHVKAPAAAMAASAQRLNWVVEDAATLHTDLGRVLRLDLDPPIVVKKECVRAVRRWRDDRVFRKHPHLGDPDKAHGVFMAPIWAVINGRKHPDGW